MNFCYFCKIGERCQNAASGKIERKSKIDVILYKNIINREREFLKLCTRRQIMMIKIISDSSDYSHFKLKSNPSNWKWSKWLHSIILFWKMWVEIFKFFEQSNVNRCFYFQFRQLYWPSHTSALSFNFKMLRKILHPI